jgi:transcriptional regulator with AAA-type ATPase domain
MSTSNPGAGLGREEAPRVSGPGGEVPLETPGGADEGILRARVEALRRLPMWEVFSEELLLVVTSAMEELSYQPGEAIIRRGEPGRHFSVMVSGRADVRIKAQDGTVTTVATMKAGQSFGEMSLLSDDVTSADVIAVDRCDTLALGKAAFQQLISQHPVLLREFVRLLSQRVKTSDVAIGVARQKEEDLTRFLQEQRSEQYSVLIGKTKAMAELQKQVAAKGQLQSPLLIQGEKGVGKELVARLVHLKGPRKEAPLVVTDCGQITESQWGDQLLGLYDEGAAAGARGLSYLALAAGGTILLKNVQAMPPGVQQRLVAFLKGGPLPTGARPDVRVIVTCRANLLEEAVAGRFSPELASLLLEDVLVVPPLREHKRDIPELAAHFVKRHAQRQGKALPALEDHALTKLVSYDYLFANVLELEEAIERSVIVTDGALIPPEAIFLGPPPLDKPRGFNLLALPRPVVQAALKVFPGGIRVVAALVFAFILYACFGMKGGPRGNVGTILVWAVWWPTLIISFFVAGRAWCAICPMATSGDLAQKLFKRWSKAERRVPAWLRDNDASFVMGGFFLIAWAEEVAGMRQSPVATGFLLLTIITGALVTSSLLPRRSWCRHLCPMGGLAGLCSTSSLLELRPTADVCAAKCKGHSCHKGDANVDGCPMFQHVMFVDSNRDCVLCLNCVRLCPNGSPQLNVRIPARELWSNLSARPQVARFVLMLLGLLVGQALLQYWEANPTAWPVVRAGLEHYRFFLISALLAAGAALPLAAFRLAEGGAGRTPDPVAEALRWQRVSAWAPLLASGYCAYQFGNVPGFEALKVSIGGLATSGLPDPLLVVRVLPAIQAVTLFAGLLLTVVTLWKIWPPDQADRGIRWFRGQAFTLGAAAAYAGLLLLLMVARPSWLLI